MGKKLKEFSLYDQRGKGFELTPEQYAAFESEERDIFELMAEQRDKCLAKYPIGATRIGGPPDLPEDIDWPEFDDLLLPFIAQFDLAKISMPSDTEWLQSGYLYLFACMSNDFGWLDNPFALIHVDVSTKDLSRREVEEDSIYPDWQGLKLYNFIPLGDKPLKSRGKGSMCRFFSKTGKYDEKPQDIAAEANCDGKDWINFITLEGDNDPGINIMWSDGGRLVVNMRHIDLAECELDEALVTITGAM